MIPTTPLPLAGKTARHQMHLCRRQFYGTATWGILPSCSVASSRGIVRQL